ncbi:hypothetical protein ASPNIDRAFT_44749 [Aspergillus niger ATCC 1015]|uniref:Uncharacterized protein n=1 Tax=Aspergillus niger (strain ATCC 1015 / CBS 113.46 / FGSC A1144 / LSHB Ac4 / NCTC 3858a / NRRL 328 / USDA 3528.7) TaxID=380704 RepID=G3XPW5_ASPNA|nr:hypothetical protein ASPNIDRAFT_44749 [Aspergillus niger ATCC 1015]
MTRLWIPGLPYKKAPVADRFKSSAQFLSFPMAPTARFVFRRNYEVPSSRSFQPVSPPRTVVRSLLPVLTGVHSLSRKPASPGVRSFAQMRQGSHLPVSVRPSTPSPVSPPAPAATGAGRSLTRSALSSRLEERRASRQARSRPWAATPKVEKPRSTTRPTPRVERASVPSDRAIYSPHMAARARRAIRRIDEVLAKPALVKASAGGRKAKSVKSVRFGEDTVIPVSCWIVRREHVFPAPLAAMGHLQGWKVTSRSEPDEEGELEKYTTYWGSDSYVMLDCHSASEPCGREGCQYNRLASIAARRPRWGPATVFTAWNMLREKVRQRGGFRLCWRISCCGIGGALSTEERWWWAIDNTTTSTPPSTTTTTTTTDDDNRRSYTGRLIALHRKRVKTEYYPIMRMYWREYFSSWVEFGG